MASPAGSGNLTLDPEEIATLVKRGQDFIANGDLASARLVLRRAAEGGDAQAALLLGSTFDPATFERLKVLGSAPTRSRRVPGISARQISDRPKPCAGSNRSRWEHADRSRRWCRQAPGCRAARRSRVANRRNATACTSGQPAVASAARNQARAFRTDGIGTTVRASSNRPPKGRTARSPHRHRPSRSAGDGNRSRSAATRSVGNPELTRDRVSAVGGETCRSGKCASSFSSVLGLPAHSCSPPRKHLPEWRPICPEKR